MKVAVMECRTLSLNSGDFFSMGSDFVWEEERTASIYSKPYTEWFDFF